MAVQRAVTEARCVSERPGNSCLVDVSSVGETTFPFLEETAELISAMAVFQSEGSNENRERLEQAIIVAEQETANWQSCGALLSFFAVCLVLEVLSQEAADLLK